VKRATKKKAAPAAGVEFRPIADLELLPGDQCDVVEEGKPELVGVVYVGILARSHAFSVPGASGFTWPGAGAHVRVNRSPNRERKAEAGAKPWTAAPKR
jgi:hypothetical protein